MSVEGGLLGRNIRFDVDIDRADDAGLTLRATGPFEIDVDYAIDVGSARVETRGGRPLGRLLASAANAMLSAGALERVLRRVVREADECTLAALA